MYSLSKKLVGGLVNDGWQVSEVRIWDQEHRPLIVTTDRTSRRRPMQT